MGQGLIPDTGAMEADIAIEFTAMMYITTAYESMTIDWLAEMADDQIAKFTMKRASKTATKKVVEEGSEEAVEYTLAASKGTIRKISASFLKSVGKIIYRLIEKMVSKTVAQAAQKAALKVATKIGYQVVKTQATAQATAAFQYVGWSVFVVTLAFDILMAVWDIMDERGFTIVFDKPMIDNFVNSINETFNESAKEFGMGDQYLNEEIDFEPFLLLFSFDEENGITINKEWLDIYDGHVHEYMTQVKGHPDNWKELMNSISLEHQNEEFRLDQERKKEEKKDNKIFLISAVVIIIVIILLLILINVK